MAQVVRSVLVLALGASAVRGSVELSLDAPAQVSEAQGSVLLRVRDGQGKALRARVQVEPVELDRRASALLGPRVRSPIVDAATPLALAPGSYRLSVSHGPRHNVQELALTLSAGSRELRDVVLDELVALPEHLCADLHAHTAHSEDAEVHGGVLGDALEAEGLDLTVATDHNRVSEIAGRLPALAGVEVTTWKPEFGHFNAFPVQSAPRHAHSSPRQLFAELAAQPDVFVQINHPRLDDHIAYFTLGGLEDGGFTDSAFTLEGASGVEVFNGYDIARPERVFALLDEVAELWERGHRVTATGGSDSHGKPGHVSGYPRTCARTRDVASFARALKRGDAFVTNGPMLDLQVQGEGPGSTVARDADGSVAVRVTVRTHPRITLETVEIWAGSALAQSLPWHATDAGVFSATLRVAAYDVRAIHARVRGGSGMRVFVERGDVSPLAFTNPVYLQAQSAPSAARSYASQ